MCGFSTTFSAWSWIAKTFRLVWMETIHNRTKNTTMKIQAKTSSESRPRRPVPRRRKKALVFYLSFLVWRNVRILPDKQKHFGNLRMASIWQQFWGFLPDRRGTTAAFLNLTKNFIHWKSFHTSLSLLGFLTKRQRRVDVIDQSWEINCHFCCIPAAKSSQLSFFSVLTDCLVRLLVFSWKSPVLVSPWVRGTLLLFRAQGVMQVPN